MKTLPKYTIGVGDRFAHQAKAQLQGCLMAAKEGVEVAPVWNKSHREHAIIGSEPESQRTSADRAVEEVGWTKPYFVDADHINLTNVDSFLAAGDFFTLDVAESIGRAADDKAVGAFVERHPELGEPAGVRQVAAKYLAAVQEAGKIYRYIAARKATGTFVTEVSMDETDAPQTPPELLVILAAIADEKIPAQTIAPKFTGRFNKGVDYVGDVAQFTKEFRDDVAVIARAVQEYDLPGNLKLSIHSGSDKFSIYGPIRKTILETGAGVHLKTAGTTWLEELIGMAEAGGDGLALAKEVYANAFEQREALCAPYAAVIDIDPSALPSPAEVNGWSSARYASALRHDQSNKAFNPHLRQLLHVGYKIAAKMGDCYLNMLVSCEKSISRNVTVNIYDRHIKPLLIG
jgi:hypothetical protein